MLQRVKFITKENDTQRLAVIETILQFYAYQGVFEVHDRSAAEQPCHWYAFIIRNSNMAALRQDIRTLHLCGYDLERVMES